ncbi:MAG: hypothetical protein CMP49_06665 [Flavobacteriales bacterium]|jgi:bifunctional DNase/RNase|nr:hypothetical protein [Flavobacteriales bacterium]|tara:strand:- start:6441 stop:7037 length:597 start_codon:yes stop_codon:yes gene_type:complete
MNLIKLNIVGLKYSQFKSGAYALYLEEDNGIKKLFIVIGACEAQAIAIGLDKNIISPRPLTHDLFKSISEKANLILEKVIIHKLEKGIFFSSINFLNIKTKETFSIDARTSDAIAVAIRFNAPIFTYKKIFEKATKYLNEKSDLGLNIEDDLELDEQIKSTENKVNRKDLEQQLASAIKKEDYELAAKIRDQINKIDE